MPEAGDQPTKPLRTWGPMALWTAGLLLVLGLIWFVTAVVVPVWRAKGIVETRFGYPYLDSEQAIKALGGPERAVKPLALYCHLPIWVADEKWRAIDILTKCGDRAVPVLQQLLHHKNPRIRLYVAHGVACTWKRRPEEIPEELRAEIVAALIRLCRDQDPSIRCEAVGNMASNALRSKEFVPVLLSMIDDDGQGWFDPGYRLPRVKLEAIRVLGWNGYEPDRVVPALEAKLRDPDPQVRCFVAEALGGFGPAAKSTVPVLTEFLADKDELIRFRAAEALSRIDPSIRAAVPVLMGKLSNKTWIFREEACRALGRIGPGANAAIPELEKALKDSELLVRLAAATALGQIDPGTQAGVPVLINGLSSDNWGRRWDACEALGQMGSRAKAAIPALEKALMDEEKDVRAAAAEALKKLRGEEPPK